MMCRHVMVGTVIHSESVVTSFIGGEAAWAAGGAGLALVGSVVGMLASQREGKAQFMCGGFWHGPGQYEEGSCVGVFVGRAWFYQLLKRSCRLAIALSWLLQEMSGASWRASVRMWSP